MKIVKWKLAEKNFPLSNPQLSAFFEQNEFTDYTAFQETVQALLEANLITSESIHNIFHYELTKEGNEVLFYFMNEIPKETEEKIDDYIRNNRFQLHNETGVTADYYKTPNFDYNVHLKVREGKTILFELNVPFYLLEVF